MVLTETVQLFFYHCWCFFCVCVCVCVFFFFFFFFFCICGTISEIQRNIWRSQTKYAVLCVCVILYFQGGPTLEYFVFGFKSTDKFCLAKAMSVETITEMRDLDKPYIITKTCLYNVDSLKPHFYIVKLGFTGLYIIFLISVQKRRLWVLVRYASLRRFSRVLTIYLLSRNMKNIRIFYL